MSRPIPTATLKTNPKKSRRDACYKLHIDMTNCVKEGIQDATDEELESLVAGYMTLMNPPEDAEDEINLPREALQQMALFAVQCISRQLLERCKA